MRDRTAVIRMLSEGMSDRAIARAVGMSHTGVAAIRRKAGIAPHIKGVPRAGVTLEDAWRRHAEPAEDGHMLWAGAFDGARPRIEYGGKNCSARKIAFRIGHGREPVGLALPECGRSECVAPEHVEDEPGRRRLRSELAVLNGYALYDRCGAGHDQATHGRFEPDGRPYCSRCGRDSWQLQARAGP